MNVVKSGKPAIDAKRLYSPEFLSDLIHLVNHDIGNPLTAIITLASLIERTGGTGGLSIPSDQLAGYGGSITRESWKIATISEHMVLLLSERSETTGEAKPHELLERAISRLEMRGQLSRLFIDEVELRPSSMLCAVDTEQLQVVLSELLLNSKREIDELIRRGADIERKIKISGSTGKGGYHLQIINPLAKPYPGDLSELFNPLVGLYRDEKCLGLGLTAAAITSAKFGLEISVDQAEDESGEHFIVNLYFPSVKN